MGYFWKCPKCNSADLKPARLTPNCHRCRECNSIVKAKLYYRDENGRISENRNKGTIMRLAELRRRPMHRNTFRADAFVEI